ncbi:hypothetical protein [Ramlibacter sp. Leaf400]|uniref:hypothetical protein n=1 Tax=Ramlibacter sp. Leaf400 TaxID=1736365 RepID=UPI0006F1DE35|nr:hypothetical protein [Ramlibacter sp. Leaf400]KQT10986.1 hypothetical protein ASG30_09310 [Ramlibacter sp. Leaf400]
MTIAHPLTATTTEPDEISLRTAYERCRKDFWPVTYEAAMEHPTYSRLVAMNARHPGSVTPARAHAWPFMAAPRHRSRSTIHAGTWTAPHFHDLKRAAAGDRDD